MTDSQIDEAILAVTQTSGQKVAMIISQASDKLGPSLPKGQNGHVMIARRIKSLVDAGRLVAQGEAGRWRNGEVKLP